MDFQLKSSYQPTGDQPIAIEQLVAGVEESKRYQTLLGVTGSGKTFTMANLIARTGLPTLVIAHNKTLAAQLYLEFRDFFPNNAVSYFVSYYDYYQPEAYIPTTDTYIEKESTINDEIDKLRLASTTNLLTRPDCIIVASVSCIYNLGSPVEFGRYILEIIEGEIISRETLLLQLSNLQYQRSDAVLVRGSYRLRGDTIQLWPAYEDTALRIETLENRIISIDRIDPVTGSAIAAAESPQRWNPAQGQQSIKPKKFVIYPAKHYMTNPKTQEQALKEIEDDLAKRLADLRERGKMIEAYRLEQKVKYDIDMIRELGFVNGIENYSRYFDGRKPGDPPFSLIDYFHENIRLFDKKHFLTIVDESHMTVPQIRAMHHGDQARKQTLIEYGFRLPSALDNRPLQFNEFMAKTDEMVFVSATPNDWEISLSGNKVVEQLIRPTGLLDPTIELRPTKGQIEDLIVEIIVRKQKGQRTLVTTLTKKMAEALTDYLNDHEKVLKLLANRAQTDAQLAGSDQSDRTIYRGDELPIDQMAIDRIDDQYFTRSQIKDVSSLKDPAFPKVAYLHSDVETLERSDILDDLRRGEYDVVVGINLLREGLDLPEVTLVSILDADKEGFLRSRTSLIQTIGRAARHQEGHVIMYADRLTQSMHGAIQETQRRRQIQWQYNQEHGITPSTIYKPIRERMIAKVEDDQKDYQIKKKTGKLSQLDLRKAGPTAPKGMIIDLSKQEQVDLSRVNPVGMTPDDRRKLAAKLRRKMKQAANDMDFELAAQIRDVVRDLEEAA
ncbi:excinuclease ABC subunit UvrB [Patescibacteria group bacterium]|nr:excinuclease ABC subunit UvrB [Patescibacteria group bacterium]